MFNIRNILKGRNDQSKSPEPLLSRGSEDSIDNSTSSAEGFLCPSCYLAFPTADTLQDHYESTHSEGLEEYNCPACRMKLGSDIELQSHITRHHNAQKEEIEIEAMGMQVKALEEGKSLLHSELQAARNQSSEILKENMKIREERDEFKQKANKLTGELADLRLEFDEVKAKNNSLEQTSKSSEDKIRKLQAEIHQRPEADDVSVLQKELVSVQKMMNDLTLQREVEKDCLEKQCESLNNTCKRLESEKSDLEKMISSRPTSDDVTNLQLKTGDLAEMITKLEDILETKESEISAMQIKLEKFSNYDEIKASLAEKESSLEDQHRIASEKEIFINNLTSDLANAKETIEEMKAGREKLFSKIEEGEGANAAMLQLKEENARLQEQFLHQQLLQAQNASQAETQIDELRTSIKKSNSSLQLSSNKCSELNSELSQTHTEIKKVKEQKEALSKELNAKIKAYNTLETESKSRTNELNSELESVRKTLDVKNSQIDSIVKEMKEAKMSHSKNSEHLLLERNNLEKRLKDLGKMLPVVQADLLDRENKLREAEKQIQLQTQKTTNALKEQEKVQSELSAMKKLYEETSIKIKKLEEVAEIAEATKSQFCDKIASLNEELLQVKLNESSLCSNLDSLKEENTELLNRNLSLEDEDKILRSSITNLQNEKNSLLNEIERLKKEISDLTVITEAQEKRIDEYANIYSKEQEKVDQLKKDFDVAKEVYLKDKMKLQKEIETLEINCAKQLSEAEENFHALEIQLKEFEEQVLSLKSLLKEKDSELRKSAQVMEDSAAHHKAQVGLLSENIQTLRDDLSAEQKKKESAEQKLDEFQKTKLVLEAKLENAIDERGGLLERCLKGESELERLQKSNIEIRRKYDDTVAALQELGRENQTLQVENMKHVTRKWTDDAEVTRCTMCDTLFTVTIRKHHCRNCGNIFCNECSTKVATVASSKKPVRVCDICFNEITTK